MIRSYKNLSKIRALLYILPLFSILFRTLLIYKYLVFELPRQYFANYPTVSCYQFFYMTRSFHFSQNSCFVILYYKINVNIIFCIQKLSISFLPALIAFNIKEKMSIEVSTIYIYLLNKSTDVKQNKQILTKL